MSNDKKLFPSPDPPPSEHWREIAEKITNEQDPDKLAQLVEKLCDRIDRLRAEKKGPHLSPRAEKGRGPGEYDSAEDEQPHS